MGEKVSCISSIFLPKTSGVPLPQALLYVPGSFGWASYSLQILRQLKGPHDLSEQHRFLESEALGSES